MGEPIVNLTDGAILNSPHYTESITKAWVSRMIDAGWAFWFGQDNILFRHCDSPVTICPSKAKVLAKVFWKRLLIPSPYNLNEVLDTLEEYLNNNTNIKIALLTVPETSAQETLTRLIKLGIKTDDPSGILV